MHVLLIDNHSRHIQDIIDELENVTVTSVEELGKSQSYDAVILSGGSKIPVLYGKEEYRDEIELIQETTKPVLGICLGCELIAYAFGATLAEHKEKVRGNVEIDISPSSLTQGVPSKVRVAEAHRWYIQNPNKLEVIGSSDWPEIIKVPGKNIWGVQFHPEVSGKHGITVLKNFLKIAKN